MLLKALYDYAQKHQLFDSLPLQKRTVHFLIPLSADGTLRGDYLVPLFHTSARGKDELGQEHMMPRFPGENNGGKAYFLAESTIAVLGCDKDTGRCLPAPTDSKMKNPTKAFVHFWKQIEEAYSATQDSRLNAILSFRNKYISQDDKTISCNAPLIVVEKDKDKKDRLYGNIGQGKKLALKTATIAFQIDGSPFTLEDPDDPLRDYWFHHFAREAFADPDDDEEGGAGNGPASATICLITGETGQPVARSHNPKIRGVPRIENNKIRPSNARLVSFNTEFPAFSSYGFIQGENAPVSPKAAALYALGVNHLLDDNDTHFSVGTVAFCFWAKHSESVVRKVNHLLNNPDPTAVRRFLEMPFEGITDREIIQRDRLYSVALSCPNKGRIAVDYWIDRPLEESINSFSKWWADLSIAPFGRPREAGGLPLSLRSLARTSLGLSRLSPKERGSADQRLIRCRIVQLYMAAFEALRLPLTLLKPVLDEFHSALVKDGDDGPTYPFDQSRFALMKLILIRNRKEGGFMPTYELADTPDPAYNCGRLLAVLEALQRRSRLAGKEGEDRKAIKRIGAGVIARFYGTASSAPCMVFPLLLKLSCHHMSKLEKGNDKDRAAARSIEGLKTDLMARFQAEPNSGKAPVFPRLLNLEDQGKFALGFYQQKAHDLEQYRKYKESLGREGSDIAEADTEEDAGTDSTL